MIFDAARICTRSHHTSPRYNLRIVPRSESALPQEPREPVESKARKLLQPIAGADLVVLDRERRWFLPLMRAFVAFCITVDRTGREIPDTKSATTIASCHLRPMKARHLLYQ